MALDYLHAQLLYPHRLLILLELYMHNKHAIDWYCEKPEDAPILSGKDKCVFIMYVFIKTSP